MTGGRRVCTFWLGAARYAFDLGEVREVTAPGEVTRVPHAPAAVRGYVNLRGQLHLVVDLRHLLELPAAEVGADSRLVILRPGVGEGLAVLVDRVGDLVTLADGEVEEAPPADDVRRRRPRDLVAGAGVRAGELVTLLRAGHLRAMVEQQAAG